MSDLKKPNTASKIEWIPFIKENYEKHQEIIKNGKLFLKMENGDVYHYLDVLPNAIVTHFGDMSKKPLYRPEVVLNQSYQVKTSEGIEVFKIIDIRATNIDYVSLEFIISVSFKSKSNKSFQTNINQIIGNPDFKLL